MYHSVFFLQVLYGLLAFLIFLVMPFMYFYFEEKDENVTVKEV
jgi:LMBR1 domain-containing protein 1